MVTKEQLARLLREAETAHREHEQQHGQQDVNWRDWYADFIAGKLNQAPPSAGAQPSQTRDGQTRKDPSQWASADEPMTRPQASYLKKLCEQAGIKFDEALTKAQASKRIGELQDKVGRQ